MLPEQFPADNFFITSPQVRIASCVQNLADSVSPDWAPRVGENYLTLTLQSSPKPARMQYARSMSKRQHEGFAPYSLLRKLQLPGLAVISTNNNNNKYESAVSSDLLYEDLVCVAF